MKKLEALEIIRELVIKYIDIDQSQLTSHDRSVVIELMDDVENLLVE